MNYSTLKFLNTEDLYLWNLVIISLQLLIIYTKFFCALNQDDKITEHIYRFQYQVNQYFLHTHTITVAVLQLYIQRLQKYIQTHYIHTNWSSIKEYAELHIS